MRPMPFHLVAGMLAVGVLIAAAVVSTIWGAHLENRSFPSLMPIFAEAKEHAEGDFTSVGYIEHLKNQGIALQRHAFQQSDILPLYGSSELVKRIPDKSSLFFQHYPTGFSVFPVGKAGTTPLIVLQKIAALGNVTQGKRVAISLSPSWFFTDAPPERPYAGNFSRQQAFSALLNPQLSFPFKKEFARRLLVHPGTMERDSLLRFLARRLARGGRIDRSLYYATWPLARLQRALYDAQDHFEIGLYVYIHRHHASPRRRPPKRATELDWDKLIADASSQPVEFRENEKTVAVNLHEIGNDETFRGNLATAPGWTDLDLCLRGLHELGVRTLVLCMPPNGTYFERGGVSKESLDLFAAQIRTIARRSGALVEAFEDHDEDLNFLVDHHDHMSAKGWMYYNRSLDDFFHTDDAELDRHFEKGHRKRMHLPTGPTISRR